MNTDRESQTATVPDRAKHAGELRARWHWTEPFVWPEHMLEAPENGVKVGK